MSDRKAPETDQEVVERVGELFDEIEPETADELDAALREAGLDPDGIGARMDALAQQALDRSPLNWRHRARRELEAEWRRFAAARVARANLGSRETIKASIHALLAQLGPAAGQLGTAHFRNLDSASDEDLASLLADLEYLSEQRAGSESASEG